MGGHLLLDMEDNGDNTQNALYLHNKELYHDRDRSDLVVDLDYNLVDSDAVDNLTRLDDSTRDEEDMVAGDYNGDEDHDYTHQSY